MTQLLRFSALVGLLAMGLTGCTFAQGEVCAIDSDCAAGTLCARDGICRTFDEVKANLNSLAQPTDAEPAVDALGSPKEVGNTDTTNACSVEYGAIFTEPTDGMCKEPSEKRKVTLLQVAASGHGAATVAEVGNTIIQAGFEEGEIALSMWTDGSLEPGCDWGIAWIRDAADRLEDCTAVFTDTMPFTIPQLVEAVIYDAVYDPQTNTVTGLLDRKELLESIDPSIRDTAANFFTNDVDTDGDGEADRTSVILEVTFED